MKVAAVDIGSNSIHMIVADVSDDLALTVIDREKAMVRLGLATFATGRLTVEAMERGVATLRQFRQIIDHHRVDLTRATATSAVRAAENGPEFIKAVYEQTGLRVSIISGEEEARLTHVAVRSAFELGERRALILDIGGGSVEAIIGDSRTLHAAWSLDLGVLRLREVAGEDPLAPAGRRKLDEHIRELARESFKKLRKVGFDLVIGTSGTVLALGLLALLRRGFEKHPLTHGHQIETSELQAVANELYPLIAEQRSALRGVDSQRADSLHLGGLLLVNLLELAGAERIMLCNDGLREGLALDAVEIQTQNCAGLNVRARGVRHMLAQLEPDVAHARQVADLAVSIFDQTARLHGLGSEARELLEYGGLLHDVGRAINFERHEQHGYYVIRSALRGFSTEESRCIALLARFHRKAKPKVSHPDLAGLPRARQKMIVLLASILRLAEGLDRRHEQAVRAVECVLEQNCLRVLVAACDAEVERAAAERNSGMLARTLDRRIEVELATELKAHAAP